MADRVSPKSTPIRRKSARETQMERLERMERQQQQQTTAREERLKTIRGLEELEVEVEAEVSQEQVEAGEAETQGPESPHHTAEAGRNSVFYSTCESPSGLDNISTGTADNNTEDDDVVVVTVCNNSCICCRKMPTELSKLRLDLQRGEADHRQALEEIATLRDEAAGLLTQLRREANLVLEQGAELDEMRGRTVWHERELDHAIQDGTIHVWKKRAGDVMSRGHQRALHDVLRTTMEKSANYNRVMRQVGAADQQQFRDLMAELRRGRVDQGEERVFGRVMSVLGDLSGLHNDIEWVAQVNSVLQEFGSGITQYKRDVAPNVQGQRYPVRRRR